MARSFVARASAVVAIAAYSSLVGVALAAASDLGLSKSNVTKGEAVTLSWGQVDERYYPLMLQGRFFNETDGGVFSIRSTIVGGLESNEFEWKNVPYPFDYIPTADYELQLMPELWPEEDGAPPRLGYAGLFRVAEEEEEEEEEEESSFTTASSSPTSDDLSGGKPSSSETGSRGSNEDDDSGGGEGNKKRTIVMAVCVGLGVPALLSVVGGMWWMRKRNKKTAQGEVGEKRRMPRLTIH